MALLRTVNSKLLYWKPDQQLSTWVWAWWVLTDGKDLAGYQAGGQEHRASSGMFFTGWPRVLCLNVVFFSKSFFCCLSPYLSMRMYIRWKFLDEGYQRHLDGELVLIWVW